MDQINIERLKEVHPILAKTVAQMDAALALQGITIRVVQGLRTIAEQDNLYAKGRTAPGEKVTNARGGWSAHNFGYAVDLIPGIRNKTPWEPNWNAAHPDYQAMIDEGIKAGLVSGARWASIKDEPHFQLPNLPVTPTDEMRAYLAAHGLQSFWEKFVPTTV